MCYRYEYYNFSCGKFDDVVDCTYVLLLENSLREKTILDTIVKYKPTSKCIVQYNKGYKNCKKNLKKQVPNLDLVACLQQVFKHALTNGYNRILVLEDDCQFDDRIEDINVTNDICEFIHENDPEVYSLGSTFLSSPWDILFSRHPRIYCGLLSHSVIYNKKYMLEKYNTDFFIDATDVEINTHWNKFMYYKPIAYQTFPDTENSQLGLGSTIYLKKILDFLIFIPFDLKYNTQPGFDRLYVLCKLLSLVLFAIIFWVIIISMV